MDMAIKTARIVNVILEPKGGGYGFGLELDLYDGTQYFTPYRNITNEDLHTLCDVAGVSSGEQLKNTLIRVVIPDYGPIQIIGSRMENKWLDVQRFTGMHLKHRKQREREETKMKTNCIYAILKAYEDRLRQRRLDPDYITTLVEQADYLIEREMDAECLKYITETFVEKISEHFYLGLNVKKYVNQLSDEYDREIAMRAIGLVVIAGCTGDYPLITNQ